METRSKNDILHHYSIQQEIYSSTKTNIFKAIDPKNNTSVIIKTANLNGNENSTINDINARLKHEFYIGNKVYREQFFLLENDSQVALVIKDIEGSSLETYLKSSYSFTENEFLNIAIRIGKSLQHIHSCGIIHKDINPSNIIYNPNNQSILIIDFGISTELSRENQDINAVTLLEGSMPYISPEQTGRMNRKIDYRSDFYSLGITLYQMLTQQLPFNAEDNLEWIHCHIAQRATPPVTINPKISPVLSDLVLKLMSKNAEDRYQSINSVLHDLRKAKLSLVDNGIIEDFQLAQKDISEKFKVSQNLEGREEETKIIFEIFDLCSSGRLQTLMVSGYSGVGKSALIEEVYKPIVSKRGRFIKGKYDQFNRDSPLSGFIQAFNQLIKQLISSESNDGLVKWKNAIEKKLSPNAELITHLIPNLEFIIGKHDAVPELPPTEAQNRFLQTLKDFISVFAQKKHPLVLFLDDLQWADIPTLNLLDYLLKDELPYFMFIGSFRDNEISHAHPLANLINDLNQSEADITHLKLSPLNSHQVNAIVSSSLNCSSKKSEDLSQIIYSKSRGNPFFTSVLLENLYKKKLIDFDLKNLGWEWDINDIEQINIPENVLEFMTSEVLKLPAHTLDILKQASCLGNEFQLNHLHLIYNNRYTQSEIAGALTEAIHNEIISAVRGNHELLLRQNNSNKNVTYKFQHDRIHQAVYTLISEEELKSNHLFIGRILLEKYSSEDGKSKTLEIVRHFNSAIDLVTEQTERSKIGDLNVIAGDIAKKSNAFKPSFEYYGKAIELLPPDPWNSCYAETLQLYVKYMTSAYLSGEIEKAGELAKQCVLKAKTSLEKARIYHLQIRQLNTIGENKQSVDLGLKALRLLGIKLITSPSKIELLKELPYIKWKLYRKSEKELCELPEITSELHYMQTKLMVELMPPCYFLGHHELFALLALKQVSICFKHGISPEGVYAFIAYNTLIHHGITTLSEAKKLSQASLQIMDKHQSPELKCKILFGLASFFFFWNNPREYTSSIFKKATEIGKQTGDFIYMTYSSYWMIDTNPNLTLTETTELGQAHLSLADSSKYSDGIDLAYGYQGFRKTMAGQTQSTNNLDFGDFNEQHTLENAIKRKAFATVGILMIHKLRLFYLLGKIGEAMKLIPEIENYGHVAIGLDVEPDYRIFSFLTYAAQFNKLDPSQKKNAKKHMQVQLKKMKQWRKMYPLNMSMIHEMAIGEQYRIAGDFSKAEMAFKNAISLTQNNPILQYPALAYELLASLYLQYNKTDLAKEYFNKSFSSYQKWGAQAKLNQLIDLYPKYIVTYEPSSPPQKSNIKEISPKPTDISTTHISKINSIDFSTIVKTSLVISGEVVLEKMLKKLLRLLRENAGAENALIILNEQDKLVIQGSSLGQNPIEVMHAESVDSASYCAKSVINFVQRSLKNVVLSNASEAGDFSTDKYISQQKVKSLLCTPILKQGQLMGIMYLENNLTSDVFTQNRVSLLELISAQLAISIDNAIIYQNLEQKVDERTKKLESTLTKLQSTQDELIESEKMAALGKLVANVAHEINTPMGAIKASAVEIEESQGRLLQSMNWLIENSNKPEREQVFNLIEKLQANSEYLSTREIRNLKRKLKKELEELGVKEYDLLASDLAMHQFQYSIEEFKNLFLNKNAVALLKFAFDLLQLSKNTKTINTAVEKSTKLISSLKIYSRKNQNQNKQTVNLRENIEEVLLLYRNLTRSKNVEVNTSYENELLLEANPSELAQVWTNIIHNALHALPNEGGILNITGKSEEGILIISISDNGIGIPEDIQDKIFSPFFTTKAVGEGTGLGLGIVQKIIKAHGGEISFESKQGKGTTFFVKLLRQK